MGLDFGIIVYLFVFVFDLELFFCGVNLGYEFDLSGKNSFIGIYDLFDCKIELWFMLFKIIQVYCFIILKVINVNWGFSCFFFIYGVIG